MNITIHYESQKRDIVLLCRVTFTHGESGYTYARQKCNLINHIGSHLMFVIKIDYILSITSIGVYR